MYLPHKRDIDHKNSIFVVVFVVIVFVLACCALSFFLARYLRQRHYEPKYIPGQYFKRKWKQWHPGSASYGQVPTQGAANADQNTSYQGAGPTTPEMTSTGVQRETSIRSIMTLPAYSPSPKPTEQIIGREGEREGMDMVVEFPETAEEQEARREDQMESLYQLRLQRRQELNEREERRRERRAARARGDTTRLEELAAESRARTNRRREESGSNTSLAASTIVAEQQSRERERRISSVSYASIGHVRHDGSRLRADSHESDIDPLLENAAVNASSPALNDRNGSFSRVQSLTSSSILTAETGLTEGESLILRPTSTRGSSRPTSHLEEREDEDENPNEAGDLGALNIPPPPDYDHLDWGDAPAYESPIRTRNEEFQPLSIPTRLPSIHIDAASPIQGAPTTPTQSHLESEEDTPTAPGRALVSETEDSPTPRHAPVS